MIAFRPIPDASAQMRFIPLVVTPGRSGFRVAFASGSYYETVAEFDNAVAAYTTYKAARKAIFR